MSVCVRERDREGGKRSGGVCMCVCVHTCFPKEKNTLFSSDSQKLSDIENVKNLC